MKNAPLGEILGPFLLGIGAFLLVADWRILDPTNIAWLAEGDPAQHYLGWLFYRNSPWTLPFGLNPQYGLELGSSIVFSDSNPLLAFLFKPFSTLLPASFQYFGFWLLLCFVLQSFFGWKLAGLISPDATLRILAASFFVFAPPMLWRLNGHYSLVGHFVILAALYLVLRPAEDRRTLYWGCLLAVAALVHAYLLLMASLLWGVDLAGKLLAKRLSLQQAIIELGVVLAMVGFLCWQAGYFAIDSGVISGGYGYFRMNLLAVIDPSGWSYLLRDIPEAGGDYEGFNYAGLGVLMLFTAAVPGLVIFAPVLRRHLAQRPLLALLLLSLTVFAITHTIGLGASNIELTIGSTLESIANVFRSSGRMFWPVFYVILLAVLYLVVRTYSGANALRLFSVALVVQLIDTSAGWQPIGDKWAFGSAWPTSLQDPFWSAAARRYTQVRYIPPGNQKPGWRDLSGYAGWNAMGTDAVYLPRISQGGLAVAEARAQALIEEGRSDPETLYILEERFVASQVLIVDAQHDLVGWVDGFYVLAPGWKTCRDCLVAGQTGLTEVTPGSLTDVVPVGEVLHFGHDQRGSRYLYRGWSEPEPWGTWSNAPVAKIRLVVAGSPERLVLRGHAFTHASRPTQPVEIRVDGVLAHAGEISGDASTRLLLPIPPAEPRLADSLLRLISLEFRLPAAVSPAELGVSDDNRLLGFGLTTIELQ